MQNVKSGFFLGLLASLGIIGCAEDITPDSDANGTSASAELIVWPGGSGLALSEAAGTHLDTVELVDRAGTATTLYASGYSPMELSFVPLDTPDLHGAVEIDLGESSVWFAETEGDSEAGNCTYWLTDSVPVIGAMQVRYPALEGEACAPVEDVAALVPVVVSLESAEVTLPDLRTSSQALSFGAVVGSFNGVTAYSNGSTSFVSSTRDTYGIPYQCVHWVNTYYGRFYGHRSLAGTGNANAYYGTASSKGLVAYANGGTTRPAVGDMITSAGGAYGHIGIIRAVGSNYVDIIHQNWANGSTDNSFRRTMTVSGGRYTIQAFSSSYPVQGWLRRSGSSGGGGSPGTCPSGTGFYCGENVGRTSGTLFYCSGGTYSVSSVCSSGCETMPTGTNDRCRTSTTTRTILSQSGSVSSGGSARYTFPRINGKTYTVTLTPTSGDADLYTSSLSSLSTTSFQCRSTNGGTTPDTCSFTATANGTNYILVQGFSASSFSLRVTER
jgi:surface antigen